MQHCHWKSKLSKKSQDLNRYLVSKRAESIDIWQMKRKIGRHKALTKRVIQSLAIFLPELSQDACNMFDTVSPFSSIVLVNRCHGRYSIPGALMTSSGGIVESPRLSKRACGKQSIAIRIGLALPQPFLMVEFTCEQISASIKASIF